MIAIVDYGMANLRSVEKAFAAVGADAEITSDPERIAAADRVVLPGVGAFCAAMENLNSSGLRESVTGSISTGKPFLGICLGLQMLFESSTEMGGAPGLGVLPGKVVRFYEENGGIGPEKVPHIGWNSISPRSDSKLLAGVVPGDRVYFVHSFFPAPQQTTDIAATSDYAGEFCCAVERGNVMAVQFHPEKSSGVGLQILRNFVNW